MRLFVAVDIPDSLKNELQARVVEPLRSVYPKVRWTRPEGRHITLKFLGEVQNPQLDEIDEALSEASSRHAPFEAAFDSLGLFPNTWRPRVLWVGVGLGGAEMTALAKQVDRSLIRTGFETERRMFAAHLTIARFRVQDPIDEPPAVDVPAEPFRVEDFALLRSELSPHGAYYTTMARYGLSGRS